METRPAPTKVLAYRVQRGDTVIHNRRRCEVVRVELVARIARRGQTPKDPALRLVVRPRGWSRTVEFLAEQCDLVSVAR